MHEYRWTQKVNKCPLYYINSSNIKNLKVKRGLLWACKGNLDGKKSTSNLGCLNISLQSGFAVTPFCQAPWLSPALSKKPNG